MIKDKESLIEYFYSILPAEELNKKVTKDFIDVLLEYIGDKFKEIYNLESLFEYNNVVVNEELIKNIPF